MKAKKVTVSDKQALFELSGKYAGKFACKPFPITSRYLRLVEFGLIDDDYYRDDDSVPLGYQPVTPRGLAAIQPLIDKAAADKLAREAEKQTGEERRVNMIAALNGKFFAAGVDLGLIDTIAYSDSPREIMVRFAITMAVRYDHLRNQYEPQIYSAPSGRTPLDIDALIREAQDARAVAEILNGMLKGEQS